MLLRAVVFVPDLLGKEMSRSGKAFQPANVLPRIPTRGQFVMTPFSSKQGPAAAFTRTDERSAVLTLAVSVIVVAAPARPRRRVHFERGVHDANRVPDDGIVCRSNAVSDQFEETRINDLSRWIRTFEALGSVVHGKGELSGIINRQRIARLKRIEPHIMSRHALKQRSFICDSPGFDVGFQPIGDLQE